MVVKDKLNNMDYELFKDKIDINVFDKKEFEELINNHEITALECIFLDKNHILKEIEPWNFNLDLTKLRSSISAKSSNSWVKAKKKFIIEKDFNPYIGKKSAWHAIRILNFGQQIGETGGIYNFSKVNDLLSKIMECNSWEEIDLNFRGIYNETSTGFKLVAPKEQNLGATKKIMK